MIIEAFETLALFVWPLTLLILVFCFRKEIKKAVARLDSLSGGGVEVKLRREIEENLAQPADSVDEGQSPDQADGGEASREIDSSGAGPKSREEVDAERLERLRELVLDQAEAEIPLRNPVRTLWTRFGQKCAVPEGPSPGDDERLRRREASERRPHRTGLASPEECRASWSSPWGPRARWVPTQ